MQTATKKTKSKKSRKIKRAKGKKSKPIKSTAKKVSGEKTDAGKLLDQENTAQDPNVDTTSIDPKESNKKSDTVEGSNGGELKQERSSVGEILTEIINTNKIAEDAQAEQETEDTADPKQAATRQSKVDKSQLPEPDVSSDQEDNTQDPNAATNSIDPEESNKKSDTIEGSDGEELKQEQPSAEEISAETTDDGEIEEQARTEHVPEDTADSEKAAAEQSNAEESQLPEPDVSSDREDNTQDQNAATNSIDPEESNKKSDTIEGSDGEELKQEQPSAEEISAETTDDGEIEEQARTEHVPEDTADSEKAAAEQSNAEESQLREPDVPSDREDNVPDPNVVNDVAEDTAAAPKASEESEWGKIFESIQKITQPSADIPGQPATVEKSTPGSTGDLFKICANEIMQKQVAWASPDDSLQQAFAKMQQTDAGYIMVGLNGALEGIVSKSDITRAMSPYLQPIFAKWRRPLDDATLKIRIKWIMSRPVRTINPETSLTLIMEHMIQFGGRCLPVTNQEGNVQGLVTAFDIFRALLKNNSNTCSEGQTDRELVDSASHTGTM